jgi:DNA mismatch repair protein MutS
MQEVQLPQSYQKKGIFEQYIYFLNHFEAKYGPKTTLLMQVGSFYELYGVDNENMKIGLVKEITSILDIELTRRNKEIQENNMKNHLMAGFPCPALSKFMDTLIDHNYTVVVMDQNGTGRDKIKPNIKLDRYISYIASPGTHISERNRHSADDERFLVQIHLEGYNRMRSNNAAQQLHVKSTYQPMLIGISAIDVTTGQSDVYEVSNSLDDQDFAINEIYRYLETHPPKELVVSSNGLLMTEQKLIEYLGLENRNIRYQLNYNKLPADYYKLAYQKQFFEKVWPTECRKSMLSVIEYLNLERTPSALISYLDLIQYTYEHNENLLSNLKRPRIWNQGSLLLLANTAITQLDLANGNTRKMGNICNMLNMTSTGMGRRLFKDRLLNPIRDANEIEERYRKVDIMIANNFWETVEKHLTGIIDLEQMHRRIELGIISPNALTVLYSSYKQVIELLNIIPESLIPSIKTYQQQFSEYVQFLSSSLDFGELSKYIQLEKIADNLFKAGFNQELDAIATEIRLNHAYIEALMDHMSQLILGGPGSQVVNLRSSEASGFYLNVTTIRYKNMIQKIKEQKDQTYTFRVRNRTFHLKPDTFKILRSNKDQSNSNITSNDLDDISETLSEAIKKIKDKIVNDVWDKFLDKLYQDYSGLYQNLSNLIAELDVIKSSAKSATKYRYCRPKIIPAQDQNTPSFLRATNFRHPLIEQLNQNSYYVPHSLQLGRSKQYDGSNNPPNMPRMDGMLLFGMNASGKTANMKAIGICLTMAQAGLYVPAQEFIYTPYHRILTRILGNDNIFRGDSSFAVEMKELRDILVRADNNSLVLGDEVCRGTETDSGMAIVAASLTRLTKLKSQYIFATHLHQLATEEEIIQLTDPTNPHQLGIYHLHVDYDPATHKLIYDRQMRPGSGSSIYGIEVARAMDLDEDFIREAHRFRQKLSGKDGLMVSPKTSQYNSQVIMDTCRVCRQPPSKDTHHIQFQSQADKDGYIGTMHKNSAKNLTPLCKICHRQIDTGELEIRGHIETSYGPMLDYTKNTPSKKPTEQSSPEVRSPPSPKRTLSLLKKK